ncbi:MAG TPA: hypothetical protein VFZ97_15055 [Acidimicrobiales bacterium]
MAAGPDGWGCTTAPDAALGPGDDLDLLDGRNVATRTATAAPKASSPTPTVTRRQKKVRDEAVRGVCTRPI